jgi:hypothetical protein
MHTATARGTGHLNTLTVVRKFTDTSALPIDEYQRPLMAPT